MALQFTLKHTLADAVLDDFTKMMNLMLPENIGVMVEKQCKKKAKGQSQPPKTPSESRQDQPKTKKVMMFPYQQQEAPLRTLSSMPN